MTKMVISFPNHLNRPRKPLPPKGVNSKYVKKLKKYSYF